MKDVSYLGFALAAAVIVALAGASSLRGDPPAGSAAGQAAPDHASNPAERLSAEQQRIADKFRRLEQVLARMKELCAASDPRRAALLEKAYKQSKEELIDVQFESLVTLLKNDQLGQSLKNQTDLQQDLKALLELLQSENRARRIESEKARIREYLRQLITIIRQEKGVRGRTLGGDDAKQLAREQGKIAVRTGELAKNIAEREENPPAGRPQGAPREAEGEEAKGEGRRAKGEGKEGQDHHQNPAPQPDKDQNPSPPPEGHPARQRLDAARQRMKEAEQRLQEARREGAAEKQDQALRELEQAQGELEKILRQLREEEIACTLLMLEARFRKMLEMQQAVYEGTLLLDKVPAAERTHNHEIEASRLSGKELQIVVEADKALLLLKEDGTAVALPEAVGQMRSDMQQVVQRLAQVKVDSITQGIEQEIIAALEEIIEALKKTHKDLPDRKMPPGLMRNGKMPDAPLVDLLAELKMIRALQMRVNRRTQRYGKLIEGEQAVNEDLVEALKRLAEREAHIRRVTRDLQSGKNQ